MYVLGHVVTAERSGLFGAVELSGGERVLELMLPDLLSCHDWAYDRCWYRSEGTRDRLVTAHMVGDAVVHYGREWTGERKRSGWAYLRMGQVARRYDEFWRIAMDNGWRLPDAGEQDSRRGWAHTLVEYSIDQRLADTGEWSELLAEVHRQASATCADPSWAHRYVTEGMVQPSKPLASQPQRYCGALERAVQPDEIHLRGLAVKFGLVETPEVLAWLRGWCRGIVSGVGADEVDDVVGEITRTVAEPDRFGYPTELTGMAGIPDPFATPRATAERR
jgi:hypothetical protein